MRVLDGLPLLVNPILSIENKILTLFVGLFKRGPGLIVNSLQSSLRDTLVDELLTVDVPDRDHVLHDGVHKGLRIRWLIKLVVARLAVADQIDDDVASEFLTVLGSDAECVSYIVHRVRVDVEDWCADGRGNLGAVSARTSTVWGRCEADLIVDDDMDSATDLVVLQPLHLQALVDNALASDGSITVHHDGHDRCTVFGLSTEEVLFSADTAHYARVYGLKMRGVRHQCQLDLVTRLTISATERRTKMILNVTSASVDSLLVLIWLDSLELSHDDLHGLSYNICKSVQSTTMSHTDHKSAGSLLDCRINAEFEARNK